MLWFLPGTLRKSLLQSASLGGVNRLASQGPMTKRRRFLVGLCWSFGDWRIDQTEANQLGSRYVVHVKNPPHGKFPTLTIFWLWNSSHKMIPKHSINVIERGGPRKVTSPAQKQCVWKLGIGRLIPFLLNICPYYLRDIRSFLAEVNLHSRCDLVFPPKQM